MYNKIRSQKKPLRFLLSRALWHSRLCYLFTIKFASGIKIRFFPTAGSSSFWLDPYSCIDEESFITSYLREGDTFIDVGANIGYVTLTAAKKIGNSGKIISIEPHPRTFIFLNKNIKANAFMNIETYNLAMGNENGKISFSNSKSDEQNFINKSGSIDVSIRRLDELFNGPSVEFLKIDTEGYELLVLQGAKETLAKTKTIYLEIFQSHFDRYNYKRKDLFRFLADQNFKIFIFQAAKVLKEIDPDSQVDLEKFENMVATRDVSFLKSRLQDYTIN